MAYAKKGKLFEKPQLIINSVYDQLIANLVLIVLKHAKNESSSAITDSCHKEHIMTTDTEENNNNYSSTQLKI